MPARTPAGYRDYEQGIVERLVFIRHAQRAGFRLDEIRQVLSRSLQVLVDSPRTGTALERDRAGRAMTEPCCASVRGFLALWEGGSPLVSDLVSDVETVADLVRRGRVEIDAQGRLVAVHGLSRQPTRHRLEVDGIQ